MLSSHLENYEKFAEFLDNLEQIKNNLGSSSANNEEQVFEGTLMKTDT